MVSVPWKGEAHHFEKYGFHYWFVPVVSALCVTIDGRVMHFISPICVHSVKLRDAKTPDMLLFTGYFVLCLQ